MDLFQNLFSDAYKDNFVAMNEAVRGKVIRPNIECTNGYIHLVDTVMIDDAPPYAVIANVASGLKNNVEKLFYILAIGQIVLPIFI